jgi:hypothetical protein
MNIIEKIIGAIIILTLSLFMLPTILGIVLTTLPADVGFIIIFCIIIAVIGIPILLIKKKD